MIKDLPFYFEHMLLFENMDLPNIMSDENLLNVEPYRIDGKLCVLLTFKEETDFVKSLKDHRLIMDYYKQVELVTHSNIPFKLEGSEVLPTKHNMIPIVRVILEYPKV